MSAIKVLHYVSAMNRGGQETLIMNVFRKIDRTRVMFDFLCTISEPGEYDEEIKAFGGKINCIDYSQCSGPLKPLKRLMQLSHWLKEHKSEYRIFHVHTQSAFYALLDVVAAKIAGIRTVIIHSHNSSTLYHIWAHKAAKIVLQWMPVERFACSEKAGQWLFGKRQFRVIKNGIITEHFLFNQATRDYVRTMQGWNEKKIIGHVGRFNDQKNHLFLLQVFHKLLKLDSSVHLVLVGTGENETQIRQFIEENELDEHVTLMGSRSDTAELYQGMDLFLFPSKFEGLPVVLVETQTAALPCLISDVITEEIDITDYIHRASLNLTAEEWAQRAKKLLDADSVRHNTTEEIRSMGYDIEMTAQELQEYYIHWDKADKKAFY